MIDALKRFVARCARSRALRDFRTPRAGRRARAPFQPIEVGLLAAGMILVSCYGWMQAEAAVGAAIDLASFEERAPDTSLWSASRLREYHASAGLPRRQIVGVLRIRSLDLRAPLYPDTSDAHLNRGVGLIPAMSAPGEGANLGIAGHRDGFFRALKDIREGDLIEVLTHERAYGYQVTTLAIVEETETGLLQPTPTASITLVTCYPFYLVGQAPQRFIVRGELISIEAPKASAVGRDGSFTT